MESTHNPEVTAQQSHSSFLKAVEAPGERKRLALELGVSEATISRLISTHMEPVLRAAAHAGHVLVPIQEAPSDRLPDHVQHALAVIAHAKLAQMIKNPSRE